MSAGRGYTTEHALERTLGALDRLHVDPTVEPQALDTALQGLTTDQRVRAETWLSRKHAIEHELVTPDRQIEEFGAERWHEKFVRLGSVEQMPGTTKEGDALRAQVWEAIPNCHFKRFQQAFSTPENYVVPRFEMQKGKVVFPDGVNWNISVHGCIVVPDCVSEDFLTNVGLCSFDDLAGDPVGRFLHRNRMDVVNGIKYLWDCCETLVEEAERDRRVLVICPEKERYRKFYPESTCIYSNEAVGRFIVTQGTQDPRGRTLAVHFHSIPHTIFRRGAHIESSYLEESAELHELMGELYLINLEVDQGWRDADAELKTEYIESGNEIIARCNEVLERCVDPDKRHANELINAAHDFRDKLGRLNPTITLTRLAHGRSALGRRLNTDRRILGHISRDRLAAGQVIDREQGILAAFDRRIVKAGNVLDSGLMLFSNTATQRMVETGVPPVWRKFRLDAELLREVRTAPYITVVQKIREKSEALSDLLYRRGGESGDQVRTQSHELVVEMHMLAKFVSAFSVIEDQKMRIGFIEETLGDSENPVAVKAALASLRAEVRQLQPKFNRRQILADHEVAEEYRDAFFAVSRPLGAIEKTLRGYEERLPTGEALKAMLDRYREFLDTIDIEGIIRKLP